MLVRFGAHVVDRKPTGDRGAAEPSDRLLGRDTSYAPGFRGVVMLRVVPTSVGVSTIAKTTPVSHNAGRRLPEAEPLAVGGPEVTRPR